MQVIYAEAPKHVSLGNGSAPGDHIPRSIFLAGGITNCPDWQQDAFKIASELDPFSPADTRRVIVNPRRANFPIHDPDASFAQIKWEHVMLRRVEVILFWFSQGSLNPIVLFELGSAMEHKKKIAVGCHPDYERKRDVLYQTALRRPELTVFDSLYDTMFAALLMLNASPDPEPNAYDPTPW